jgi:hypothetical protein
MPKADFYWYVGLIDRLHINSTIPMKLISARNANVTNQHEYSRLLISTSLVISWWGGSRCYQKLLVTATINVHLINMGIQDY